MQTCLWEGNQIIHNTHTGIFFSSQYRSEVMYRYLCNNTFIYTFINEYQYKQGIY